MFEPENWDNKTLRVEESGDLDSKKADLGSQSWKPWLGSERLGKRENCALRLLEVTLFKSPPPGEVGPGQNGLAGLRANFRGTKMACSGFEKKKRGPTSPVT